MSAAQINKLFAEVRELRDELNTLKGGTTGKPWSEFETEVMQIRLYEFVRSYAMKFGRPSSQIIGFMLHNLKTIKEQGGKV